MSASPRLPEPYGLLLQRGQTLNFSFEDRAYQGVSGDTIASALMANGQSLLSRSFKYHRPRGALTMAGQDANSLVQLPADPNVLADREALREGLRVWGQNHSGSLARDRGAWLGRLAKFMPVGFYYKAFFKPKGMWEKWAPLIRKKAGLGVIDTQHQPGYYDKQYKFVDVLVVGAGPAGSAAALEAAQAGASVLLVEESPVLGGALTYARFDAAGQAARAQRAALLEQVQAHPMIELMTDAVCNGWFADNWVPVIQGQRMFKVRAQQTVFAVGMMEQQAVFHNNDLPGVMMSSAAQRLMQWYAVKPGQNAVVLTGNSDGYATALDLLDAGVKVAALVDMREAPPSDALTQAVAARGVRVQTGHTVYEARQGAGGLHLGSVEIRAVVGTGQVAPSGEVVDCDLLCMAVGYTPCYQLPCQAGGQLSYDDERSMFNLSKLPANVHIAGSVNGVFNLDDVMLDGRAAAQAALQGLGKASASPSVPARAAQTSPNFPWPMFAHPKGKEFVDFDEDLQIADIVNATRDGYEHVQLVKRYSTCGMGPSQGRHSALATARLVAAATGKTVGETGVTTARPPYAPERLAHCAGRSFYPYRRSNMHARHLEAGAQMLQAGAWERPAYYGAVAQRDALIAAEVNNVRQNVGLVDVSTLGGLEVRGPDAPEFLNRFYTFGFVKQPVGRARYALLTNEAGVVIDDGVACRFSEQHYYVTATTGGVDNVFRSMLKWQALWGLDVDIANVTSAFCGVNIAGPRARAVLQQLCSDVDLSAEAFPYMGVREGTVAGIAARLIRVGFVGELGFEIHVPQHCGEALWDALMQAGEAFGIRPFGIEAQRVLRLEKGHIIIGQDTDAMSNPMEVQMDWAVSRKKPFFVGGRTIAELDKKPLSRQLVGFVIDASEPMPKESHLVLDGEQMCGRVTSVSHSPTLQKTIGMAYVRPDQAQAGTRIVIKVDGGQRVQAEVVSMPFYDPNNERQQVAS